MVTHRCSFLLTQETQQVTQGLAEGPSSPEALWTSRVMLQGLWTPTDLRTPPFCLHPTSLSAACAVLRFSLPAELLLPRRP